MKIPWYVETRGLWNSIQFDFWPAASLAFNYSRNFSPLHSAGYQKQYELDFVNSAFLASLLPTPVDIVNTAASPLPISDVNIFPKPNQ